LQQSLPDGSGRQHRFIAQNATPIQPVTSAGFFHDLGLKRHKAVALAMATIATFRGSGTRK
jgi:hypothetical protein